jgi:hypothetical protein
VRTPLRFILVFIFLNFFFFFCRWGVPAAMEASQRLMFGNLLGACLLEDDLMPSQQPVMPDLDWKRSKVVLVEFLRFGDFFLLPLFSFPSEIVFFRSISFQLSLRKPASVCEHVDVVRVAIQESFVTATHSLLHGAGSSLPSHLLSIVENLSGKPLRDEVISRTWAMIHRGLSLHRDRICSCLAEQQEQNAIELCDPRRLRSLLEKMGPPPYLGPEKPVLEPEPVLPAPLQVRKAWPISGRVRSKAVV